MADFTDSWRIHFTELTTLDDGIPTTTTIEQVCLLSVLFVCLFMCFFGFDIYPYILFHFLKCFFNYSILIILSPKLNVML